VSGQPQALPKRWPAAEIFLGGPFQNAQAEDGFPGMVPKNGIRLPPAMRRQRAGTAAIFTNPYGLHRQL